VWSLIGPVSGVGVEALCSVHRVVDKLLCVQEPNPFSNELSRSESRTKWKHKI